MALVKKHAPQCIFLIETKGSSERLEKITRRLGFDKWKMEKPQGSALGLAMLWHGDFNMDCLWKKDRMVCCEVHPPNGGRAWKLLGVYGTPYRGEKESF